jgi:hypothetical protein
VNLADMTLLQRYAMLMLKIAIERSAKEPVALPVDGKVDSLLDRVNASNITKSVGFRKMRAWFKRLSPSGKNRARQWMTTHLLLVDKLKKQVEAQGDTFSYAELELDIRAAPTGELLDGPNLQPTEEQPE